MILIRDTTSHTRSRGRSRRAMNLLTSFVFVIASLYCLTVGVLEVAVSAALQIPSFCSTGYTADSRGVTLGTWLIVDGIIIICYISVKFVNCYSELTCDSSCGKHAFDSRTGSENDVEIGARARAEVRTGTGGREEEKKEVHRGDVPHIRSSPHINRLSSKRRAGGFPSNNSIITMFPYIDLFVDVAMLFKFAWAITGTALLWNCVQDSNNDMIRTIFTLAVTQTYIICAIRLARLVL